MRAAFITGVCGLLLVCNLSAAAAEKRELERELSADTVRSIVLHGGNGSARIQAGDADTIRIRVAVRPDRLSDTTPWQEIKNWFLTSAYDDVDELIEAVRLDTASSGGELSIGLKPSRRTRESKVLEDWQLTVPRELAVRLTMARAETAVTGVAGGVEISIGNGSTTVDVPGGDLDVAVTVGKAEVRTGSTAVRRLSLRSEVGDTRLWMNGLAVDYPDPPGPGSRIRMSGQGEDSIEVSVRVGDASVRVNER